MLAIPNGALIHCRVSTPKQKREGESLEDQVNVCQKLIEDRGWKLVHPAWCEDVSGRKNVRPCFDEILEFIDTHPGLVKYYVFRCIDRFTRAGPGMYGSMKAELSKRGIEMVDTYGVIQPMINTVAHLGLEFGWSWQSPSQISESVSASVAQQEVTNILTRMIGQEIILARQGYRVRAPADGYINVKVVGKKRTIQAPDPQRAHFFIPMFEMCASGQYEENEIVDRINAMGFKTKFQNRWDKKTGEIVGQKGGLLLSVERLRKIIQNPIYCAVEIGKWTNYLPVKAPYEGLISRVRPPPDF